MNTNEKLAALRAKMREDAIDAYIILSEDAHQSEYVAAHWRSREWLTGFDGSAGAAAVTQNKAVLWVDGRYYIQAARQIAGSAFQMIKAGIDDTGIYDWLAEELLPGAVVGVDGRTLSVSAFEKYDVELTPHGIKFETGIDLIADIWQARPSLPQNAIFEHSVKYAGKTRIEKLSELRVLMRKKGMNGYLISSLDDIAWLFNLRGNDIAFLPVFYAYAFIGMSDAFLFVDEAKLSCELKNIILSDGIILRPYGEIEHFLLRYHKPGAVFIDPDRISIYLKELFSDIVLRRGTELSSNLKAVKNETELRNTKHTQVKDGVAMVQFIKWLKEKIGSCELEEADIHDKLLEFRGEQDGFAGASFFSIAAYMSNAALMHYSPIKGKSAKLARYGMLLCDSGGQYLGGTTDITRTIALGEVPDEMKRDFTTVLRAHIALATTRFLYGASGAYLDVIPRRMMWAEGLDYKCGTGHGIGYFLSVHEGPQRFRFASDHSARLEPGMLLTNEPGIYKEGCWGIRTENTMQVVLDIKTTDGQFLKFETISYCPIDLEAIDTEALSAEERTWLNGYHATVYEKLAPALDQEHRQWLKEHTREI